MKFIERYALTIGSLVCALPGVSYLYLATYSRDHNSLGRGMFTVAMLLPVMGFGVAGFVLALVQTIMYAVRLRNGSKESAFLPLVAWILFAFGLLPFAAL